MRYYLVVKAVGVRAYGGPEALETIELVFEPLGAGQVRVRVSAAAVNPTYTLARAQRSA
jgi:NADPH:quinone reductase